MNVTRRKILLATGASVGLAGCIGDSSSGSDGDPDDNDTDDNGNGDGDDGSDGGDGSDGNDSEDGTDGSEYDVFQLGSSPSQPLWAIPDEATGFITLIEDEYDDLWMVDDPEEDALKSWLDETDLETSSIVYVETVGPNTCYNKVNISDLAVGSTKITGTAEAVDTSEEDEMCGSAITYPSAFVRVTGDDLPSRSTFTVTDGWGESDEVSTDGRYLDPSNLPGHVRPDGDPPKLEKLTCENEEFQRLQGPQNAALGEAYNDEDLTFAMRVHTTQTLASDEESSPRVERGNEVRVTMHNVSTDIQETGNRHKWNLQVLTLDGWEDVRGTTGDEPIEYTDEGVTHRPGEGFEWVFEMTAEGILAGHTHEDTLEVCPDLQPGRYRFVYRGIVSGEPLAVEFHYNG